MPHERCWHTSFKTVSSVWIQGEEGFEQKTVPSLKEMCIHCVLRQGRIVLFYPWLTQALHLGLHRRVRQDEGSNWTFNGLYQVNNLLCLASVCSHLGASCISSDKNYLNSENKEWNTGRRPRWAIHFIVSQDGSSSLVKQHLSWHVSEKLNLKIMRELNSSLDINSTWVYCTKMLW